MGMTTQTTSFAFRAGHQDATEGQPSRENDWYAQSDSLGDDYLFGYLSGKAEVEQAASVEGLELAA